MADPAPLLQVEALSKNFALKGGAVLHAVQNVSFSLRRGRTLALVGESGCGKSTTGRMILRLIEPSAGSIRLDGEELTAATAARMQALRRRIGIVFQDPMGALNPRRTVGASIIEPLLVHRIPASEHSDRLAGLMKDVELDPDFARRYPHELSGGQRQRVCIARALALQPELIVADEPVSALDASIQAQVLDLLLRLQAEHGLSYLFISHDLSVVRFLSDDVAVMYAGRIVEQGPKAAIFSQPAHPYTRALLAAIPVPEAGAARVQPLEGILPDATQLLPGCAFASRCPSAMPRCQASAPPLFELPGGQRSACWLNESAQEAS
ncbi:ABC transporter ATP-binding protein [bacterium]|nr:ABC transporter ATP-binding protein [bacterium]